MWDLGDTGRTPCCPEDEDYVFAPVFGESVEFAGDVCECEIGCLCAVRGGEDGVPCLSGVDNCLNCWVEVFMCAQGVFAGTDDERVKNGP